MLIAAAQKRDLTQTYGIPALYDKGIDWNDYHRSTPIPPINRKKKQGKGQTHNLAYNPYIALTSLPYAGGHAGLAWGLVLTLAGSGLLLALAGAALWRTRQAHAVAQVIEN